MQRICIQQGIHQLLGPQQTGGYMHHKEATAEIRHILQRRTYIHISFRA